MLHGTYCKPTLTYENAQADLIVIFQHTKNLIYLVNEVKERYAFYEKKIKKQY